MIDDLKTCTEVQSRPQLPRLLLYSKAGAIPYLDYNFIRKKDGIIFRDDKSQKEQQQLTTIFLGDLYDFSINGVLDQFPKMTYFADTTFMITLADPLMASYQDLKSTPAAVPLVTYHGKRMVTVNQLMDIVSQSGTVTFQSLADINTPPTAGKKWTAKAANRSVAMLEEILAKKGGAAAAKEEEDQTTKRLKTLEEGKGSSSIWATCSGGYSARDRFACCKAIAAAHVDGHNLAGVVIDGFFGYHSSREVEVEGEEGQPRHRRNILEVVDQLTVPITSLLKEVVLPALPPGLPLYLPGALLPDDMLKAIGQLGIDTLDSSIASLLTAVGIALPSPLIDLSALQLRFTRTRTNEDGLSPSPLSSPPSPSPITLLDLTGDEHRRSAIALSSACDCHTCLGGFTRAYINHLLRRHELNGSMLLQAHNHWALTVFFGHLRQLTREGKMDSLLKNSGLLMKEEGVEDHQ